MKLEIQQNGPPYLVRYRPNNSFSLDELENNYVYFSNREQLNDPYDSIPSLISLTKDPKELKCIYDTIFKNIKEQEGKDFFKGKFSEEDIAKMLDENIIPFINDIGIACFSASQTILPLWANYANNYEGLCLQFNTEYDSEFFKEIKPVSYEKDLNKREFSLFKIHMNYLIYFTENLNYGRRNLKLD